LNAHGLASNGWRNLLSSNILIDIMVSLTDNSVKCGKIAFTYYGTVCAFSLNCYSCLHIYLDVFASHLKAKVVCIMWLLTQMTSGFIVIRVSISRQPFRELNILPVPSHYILSLLLFITKNKDQFMTNSQIHRITTRQTSDLYVPAANLTLY